MRSYRARRSTIWITHGFLAAIVAVCVVGVLFARPTILYVVFLMFALWRWYQILAVPIEVRVDDGRLELRSAVGRKSVAIDEVTRVKRAGRGIYIEYPEGSFNLYGDMEGAEEFLEHLQEAKPGLEVETTIPIQQRGDV